MKVLLSVLLFFLIYPSWVNAAQCPMEQSFNFQTNRCEKIQLPEYAVFNSQKSDWQCQVGYKKIASKNLCQKVVVPEHGKINYSGDDFICDRGFTRHSNWCIELKIPENATLEATGNNWQCIATYTKEADRCVKVDLPKDASFFKQGFDWYCNNQFIKEGSKCQKFEIPENAHLTFLGNDWACNSGFVKNHEKSKCDPLLVPLFGQATLEGFECEAGYDKQGQECIKVEVVENGKFYKQGDQFYCQSGYQKDEEKRKCQKIVIPENARMDQSSLDGWSCIGGYIKQGDKCEKFTTEHLIWQGSSWKCELGYKKDYGSQNCQKINLPDNARFEMNSDGWTCLEGYTKNYRDNRCDKSSQI